MIVRVVDACCSSAASIRTVVWRCEPQVVGHVLQLVKLRKEEILEKVREKMGVEEGKGLKLLVRWKREPVEEINRRWERMVLVHMKKLLEMETLLWNLSTFGGAFSSMGDYDSDFARRAGAVSKRQLTIARDLGNPTLEARCFLYVALSHAQLGDVVAALKTIKLVLYWARITANTFLENCARGCRAKVKDISRFRDKYKCK